jgi:hypothetical protein
LAETGCETGWRGDRKIGGEMAKARVCRVEREGQRVVEHRSDPGVAEMVSLNIAIVAANDGEMINTVAIGSDDIRDVV